MSVASYVNKKVVVITTDGKTLMGTLVSHDQVTNIVLTNTVERTIRPADDPEGSTEEQQGAYVLRGDCVVLLGLVDEKMDQDINWTKVHGSYIGSTKHT